MDLESLIIRMTPFDCHTKEDFVKLLEEFPELKSDLVSQLESNKKWTKKATAGEVKFIINFDSWKTSKLNRKYPYAVLNVIKSIPVVSLNV